MSRQPKSLDPYFQDEPHEIHRDDNGELIAEVFLLPAVYLNQGLIKRRDDWNERRQNPKASERMHR